MSNDVRDIFKKINELSIEDDNAINLYDSFDIELSESFVIETGIVGFTDDGVIVEADEATLEFLDLNDVLLESVELDEAEYQEDSLEELIDLFFFFGHNPNEMLRLSIKEELIVKNLLNQFFKDTNSKSRYFDPDEEKTQIAWLSKKLKVSQQYIKQSLKSISLLEAEYQGRKVSLGKPFLTPDGPKKRSVYVRKPNGKVVKVNFGDKNMRIKKSNPARRKSFRARHNCANPGPRWKARFWSCRAW
jgi:hypothetical protein